MDVFSFRDRLQEYLKSELPGEKAHLKAMPVHRPLSSEAKRQAAKDYRASAVAILLYPAENSLKCVLIQRPEYDGVHGGQVSFPGGKMDPTDLDLEMTARRECFEEIGYPMNRGMLLGTLTEVFIPVSKFLVQPYVLFEENLPPLINDQREVAEIISFDVHEFTQLQIERTTIDLNRGVRLKDIPYFPIENRIVWGATAIMLAEFQEVLRRVV